VVGCGWVLRVDAADGLEGAWVALEHAGEVAGYPSGSLTDLDEYGAEDLVGLHEFEKLVDGGVFCWRSCAGCEGEGGIVLPDVNVGVDERRGSACDGRGVMVAAADARKRRRLHICFDSRSCVRRGWMRFERCGA